MSDEVQAIKEAQINFLSFLWKDLMFIRELQIQKRYYDGFTHLYELTGWLPEDFQVKFGFREKAKKLLLELENIKTDEPIFQQRKRNTDQIRNIKAKKILDDFIPELTIMLDKKGYMEIRPAKVEHGME